MTAASMNAALADNAALRRVREAVAADAPFLAALYRGTRADLAQLPGDGDALIAMQQRIHAEGQRRACPHARRLVLCEGGRAVASMLLDRDAQRLRVVELATLPEARRRGAATQLLRWAQREAAGAALPLLLQVRNDQPGACRLYLALGFVPRDADALFQHMAWHPA
jgi:ribosomal protein S18 acetylase RimI-like enzyme